MYKILFISTILISSISILSIAEKTFNISSSVLSNIENKYGTSAKQRVENWDSMIEYSKNESVLNKIKNGKIYFI